MPRYHRPYRLTLWLLAALTTSTVQVAAQSTGADPAMQPWAYRTGETGDARQGNFCDSSEAALEIAQIFERFGARTGFSALSSAANCATRVHTVTPESLLHQVEVKLENGSHYVVNFIQVQAEDGTRPVLITTRRLIEAHTLSKD